MLIRYRVREIAALHKVMIPGPLKRAYCRPMVIDDLDERHPGRGRPPGGKKQEKKRCENDRTIRYNLNEIV